MSPSQRRSRPAGPGPCPHPAAGPAPGGGRRPQLSRFPWGEDPARWLVDVARAADDAGLAGFALMDHLIQIPQVDRAWAPIPEPWVMLGLLAGLDTALALGTLVTPITFRAPGITAKAAATLDVLSGGRVFVGVGARWWEREHAAYGLAFPGAAARLNALEAGTATTPGRVSNGSAVAPPRRRTPLAPTPGRPTPGDLERLAPLAR